MTPIDVATARQWCQSQGATFGGRGKPSACGPTADFKIPVDAGQRVAMVGRHLEPFRGNPALVWFDDWSVWPSGERMHIFERFLASYDHRHPLIDMPAFLFTSDEYEDLVSFVTIGVLFLWDVHVVAAGASPLLSYSHDEWGWMAER
jgi:hypothetical protein